MILTQDISTPTGEGRATPIIGHLGGVITQLALVISTAIEYFGEKTKGMLDQKVLTQFINSYIGSQMKSEYVNQYISHSIDEFLKGLPEPLSLADLPKLQGEVYDKFREQIGDVSAE